MSIFAHQMFLDNVGGTIYPFIDKNRNLLRHEKILHRGKRVTNPPNMSSFSSRSRIQLWTQIWRQLG